MEGTGESRELREGRELKLDRIRRFPRWKVPRPRPREIEVGGEERGGRLV